MIKFSPRMAKKIAAGFRRGRGFVLDVAGQKPVLDKAIEYREQRRKKQARKKG